MAKRKETLQQRIITRWENNGYNNWTSRAMQAFVRAELDRLARQVRAIKYVKDSGYFPLYVKKTDVLALIRAARR